MKKTALLIAFAGFVFGGMSLVAPQTASAADFGLSFGSRWNGNQRSHSSYRNDGYQSRGYGWDQNSRYGQNNYRYGQNNSRYGQNNYGYGQNGYGYGNQWSGRSNNQGHYDYHAPSITPHGDHFHVTPGHYDYHRGGHGHNY